MVGASTDLHAGMLDLVKAEDINAEGLEIIKRISAHRSYDGGSYRADMKRDGKATDPLKQAMDKDDITLMYNAAKVEDKARSGGLSDEAKDSLESLGEELYNRCSDELKSWLKHLPTAYGIPDIHE